MPTEATGSTPPSRPQMDISRHLCVCACCQACNKQMAGGHHACTGAQRALAEAVPFCVLLLLHAGCCCCCMLSAQHHVDCCSPAAALSHLPLPAPARVRVHPPPLLLLPCGNPSTRNPAAAALTWEGYFICCSLLQQQLAFAVEQEHAEGAVQQALRLLRHKPCSKHTPCSRHTP